MTLSCIQLNNEHPLSFVDGTEGKVNVKTNEFLNVEIYHCSDGYCGNYCITYWNIG